MWRTMTTGEAATRFGYRRTENRSQFATTSDPPRTPVKRNSVSERREKELPNLHITGPITAPVSQQRKDAYTPNIVIFGETGVGKSSVINLIANQKLAHTSNAAVGCTFQHEPYFIELGKMLCALWDTTGLDEGSEGTVPAKEAENNLRDLLDELARSGGLHLIIYCIRSTRLTKALKHNYDLFYSMVCRKKVPVALVVTGLEHQPVEMETWWTQNESTLQRRGMRFDAHACVTTLNVEDAVIQQRRSASRTTLRELVIKYSRLPPSKIDTSPLSRVLPFLHSILSGISSTGGPGNTTVIRKVVVCGSFGGFLPGTTAVWNKCIGTIGSTEYDFIRVDVRAVNTVTPRALEDAGGMGAGLLMFYIPALDDNRILPTDVDALKQFYDVAGGQLCPVIVVLRGCDTEEVAWSCKTEVALHYPDIQAYFVPFPCTDAAREKLDEMVEHLYVDQVEAKPHNVLRKNPHSKRSFAGFVDG